MGTNNFITQKQETYKNYAEQNTDYKPSYNLCKIAKIIGKGLKPNGYECQKYMLTDLFSCLPEEKKLPWLNENKNVFMAAISSAPYSIFNLSTKDAQLIYENTDDCVQQTALPFSLALSKVNDWNNITDKELTDMYDPIIKDYMDLLSYGLLSENDKERLSKIIAVNLDKAQEFKYRPSNDSEMAFFTMVAKELDALNKHNVLPVYYLKLHEFFALCSKYPKYLYQLPAWYKYDHTEISIPTIMKDKTMSSFHKNLIYITKVCSEVKHDIPKYLEKEMNELIPLIKMHGYNVEEVLKYLIDPYISNSVEYKPTKVKTTKSNKKITYCLEIDTPNNIVSYSTKAKREEAIEQYKLSNNNILRKLTIIKIEE